MNKVFPSMNRGVIGQTSAVDFNQIVTPGVYYFIQGNYTHSNTPPESTGGILRVYGGSNYFVQEYSNYGRTSYSRIKWGETWYDWQRIDNFGCNTIEELSTSVAGLLPVASSISKGLNYGDQFYTFETNTTEIVIKYVRKPGGGMVFDILYWLYNNDGEVIRVSVPSSRESPVPVYAESLSGGKKIMLNYRPTIYYGNDTIVIRPNSSGCITINNPFKSTTDMSYITSIKHNETRITDVSNLSEAEYL